jgi:hypothetical protein
MVQPMSIFAASQRKEVATGHLQKCSQRAGGVQALSDLVVLDFQTGRPASIHSRSQVIRADGSVVVNGGVKVGHWAA